MSVADLLVKWIHVSSACVLLGASALLAWGLIPALGPSNASDNLVAAVVQKARTLVHSSLGLLLITGAYNFWRALQNDTLRQAAQYQEVLGAKIVIFVIIFVLAIMALKRSPDTPIAPRGQALLPWIALLTLLLVLLSSYLNMERIQLLTAGR